MDSSNSWDRLQGEPCLCNAMTRPRDADHRLPEPPGPGLSSELGPFEPSPFDDTGWWSSSPGLFLLSSIVFQGRLEADMFS